MKKSWVIGLALAVGLTFLAVPERAQAITGYGYVCSVRFLPRSFNYTKGNYGFLILQLNTQVGCGGTNRLVYLYSEGATDRSADPLFLYSQAAINTMMTNASQAAMNRQQIFFDISDTNTQTLRSLEFR